MQLRHEQTINRVLPYDSSKGALLPRPRLTQLQIPNSERTFFGPDASPPAVIPNNILVGQGAALSEESYSVSHLSNLIETDEFSVNCIYLTETNLTLFVPAGSSSR
jgi:hypothetical protein